MKSIALLLALVFLAACRQAPHAGAAGYHCPMHPQVKDTKPGKCPICGMDLVADAKQAPKQEGRILFYRDPAQPAYQSPNPGLNPETGNTLEPVYDKPSEAAVMITAEKQQWIGLTLAKAEYTSTSEPLRAPARVVIDEARISRVQSRNEGWIKRVLADSTGRMVRKGEPLLVFYSPELVASQNEYLIARRAISLMQHSTVDDTGRHNVAMAEAAKRRLLHHWNMEPAEVAELERTAKPIEESTLRSPVDGFIIAREAFPSQMIKPDMALYTIADISQVWIVADLNQSDAPLVHAGQTASLEGAGRAFNARVTQVLPQADPMSRTIKVRLEAANPAHALRPDMLLEAVFPTPSQARLTVPEDAVIDTGAAQTVYVPLGEGRFEPRRIATGARHAGRVQVTSGLKPGDQVVASGAFLLDSESRMRSGSR